MTHRDDVVDEPARRTYPDRVSRVTQEVNHIVRGTPGSKATFSTFATFPAPYLHNFLGPLIDQLVGTSFLALFVFAVTDACNLPVGANLTPFIVGMVVMAIGISFGALAGLRYE